MIAEKPINEDENRQSFIVLREGIERNKVQSIVVVELMIIDQLLYEKIIQRYLALPKERRFQSM